MLHIICAGSFVFLAILGLIDIIKTCVFLTFKDCDNPTPTIVLPIKSEEGKQNAEFVLRRAISKIMWDNTYSQSKLICLDCGMDEEAKEICRLISVDYDFIDIYYIDDFEIDI